MDPTLAAPAIIVPSVHCELSFDCAVVMILAFNTSHEGSLTWASQLSFPLLADSFLLKRAKFVFWPQRVKQA